MESSFLWLWPAFFPPIAQRRMGLQKGVSIKKPSATSTERRLEDGLYNKVSLHVSIRYHLFFMTLE
jgi:hypothetical protein